MATLLGHLSQFASFLSQGEVLCTQGLAYLLKEYPAAGAAFAEEISTRSAADVRPDVTWHAEQRQADGTRPDLEARVGKRPIVKIEAKLTAAIDPGQLRSYVSDLQVRLQGSALDGVLVLLVPSARAAGTAAMLKSLFGLEGEDPWRLRLPNQPDVCITVLSWEEALAVLGRVESERFRAEIEQFEDMYRQLGSTYIEPLADVADLIDWRDHEDDFFKLVDRVTRLLSTDHAVYPMGTDPPDQIVEGLEPRGYTRRYVCRRLGTGKESCFAVGLRDPFAGYETPIWLRFNRTTGRFAEIRGRLESSHLAPKLLTSGGHIWLPLDVPIGVGAEQMVDALVTEAEAIRVVAFRQEGG